MVHAVVMVGSMTGKIFVLFVMVWDTYDLMGSPTIGSNVVHVVVTVGLMIAMTFARLVEVAADCSGHERKPNHSVHLMPKAGAFLGS